MSGQGWIDAFLATAAGRYFVRVDPNYMADTFNFFGIRQKISQHFRYAMDLLRCTSYSPDRLPQDWPRDIDREAVHRAAVRLYGLLHARFLLTRGQKQGLDLMWEKYSRREFQECPRHFCDRQICLPYGPHEELDRSVLRMFCPNCREVYVPEDPACNTIDGAFFGPSWVDLFIEAYACKGIIPAGAVKRPLVRLFGFKVEALCSDEEEGEED